MAIIEAGEVWFASSQAYEDQRARGLVACAFCGSTEVARR
nr:DUF1178 family protein [Synechococcus sp. GFB01]